MNRRLDLYEVLARIGSSSLTWAVERDAVVVLAPDYVVAPEGQLPINLLEWVDRIGGVVHHGTRLNVFYLHDDIAGWALSRLQSLGVEL